MAKPKGTKIVGWGTGWGASKSIEIVAEKDVDQRRNAKAGLGSTWSKGHQVRQLGLAKLPIPKGFVYFLYSHSQVSNGNPGYEPPAYVGMNKEDLEWLFAEIAKELFGEA